MREWHALVIEEEELEKLQNDPDRFKRRGGAMLKEEKSRKRVQMLKPKVCHISWMAWGRSAMVCAGVGRYSETGSRMYGW